LELKKKGGFFFAVSDRMGRRGKRGFALLSLNRRRGVKSPAWVEYLHRILERKP